MERKIPYKKLRNYICDGKHHDECVFGGLFNPNITYNFKNEKGEWVDFQIPPFRKEHEFDFLLDYYVMFITPRYRIEKDKIIPYLYISLYTEEDVMRYLNY